MTAKEVILDTIAMKPVGHTPFAPLLGGSWALGVKHLLFEAVFKKTTEKIEQTCNQCTVDAGTNGSILMPGCDISPSAPFEKITTTMKVVRSYP
jgi:hypothetical protein